MRLLSGPTVLQRGFITVSILSALLFATASVAGRAKDFISIVDALQGQGMGTDRSVRGEILPLADALCVMVQENETWPLDCRVVRAGDKVSWWQELDSSGTALAVVRSDEQRAVWKRQMRAGQAVQGGLRHLYALEMQPVLLLVPDRSPARRLEDLVARTENHRFFGGDRDQETLAEVAEGLTGQAVEAAQVTRLSELVDGLCAGMAEGAVWWMIAPSIRSLGRIFSDLRCSPRVIPIDRDKAQELARTLSYLAPGAIPAGTFSGQGGQIETLGLATTIVSSRKVPELPVHQFMAGVFNDFYRLQSLYIPAVSVDPWLFPWKTYYQYQSAPLHEGAGRYFRERLQRDMDLQWVVLGSFEDLIKAERLATLLAKTYPESFPDGLQVRLDSSGLFGVIAGWAAPRDEAQYRREQVTNQIPGMENAVLRDAFLGWSPQLLPQKPRIYPHAAYDKERKIAESLSGRLKKSGWQVRNVEMMGKKSPSISQLRYFRQSEQLVAEKIFKDLGGSKSGLRLEYVPGYEFSTRIRAMHFEIWIAPRAKQVVERK